MDTIHIFRAENFKEAFKRALEIGLATEEEYVNIEGETIHWRLSKVVTLDIIRDEDIDCKEVYSEFVDLPEDEQFDLDSTFQPRNSKPTQTI